jgi:hypothetical protein
MQHGPAASSGSNPKAPGSAGGYLLAALTAQHVLPAIYYDREYVAAGGLMTTERA